MEDNPFIKNYKDVKESKIATRLFVIFVYILLIFYVCIFSINIAFRTEYRYITINGPSMQPTLNPNPIEINGEEYQDGVYIKLTQEIDYGDIIIIDRSEEEHKEGYTVIKRVLAFKGDKISIVKLPVGENGEYEYRFIRIKAEDNIDTIYYQGEIDEYILYEDYIKSYDLWNLQYSTVYNGSEYEYDFYDTFLSNAKAEQIETHNVIINGQILEVCFFVVGSDKGEDNSNQIFYMGDNRTQSRDARLTGTANIDKVVGKVVSIVHNSYSLKNSLFGWIEKVWDYFVIIWNEIIDYFAIK